VLFLLALSTGLAGRQARPSDAELAALSERGRALADYDQAVWHATDALEMADPMTAQGQKPIASKQGDRWTVVFGSLNPDQTKFLVSYEAVARGRREGFAVTRDEPPKEDSRFYLLAALAIERCLADFGPLSRPYNSAVLPAGEGRWYVYLYPAQTKAGIYPIGGDARYLVSPDGRTILEKRILHTTVVEPRSAPREKASAGRHTHTLGDLPEDTDVLHALERGAPESVATPHFVYEVSSDGTIEIRKEKRR
jgi:hypothetical protein